MSLSLGKKVKFKFHYHLQPNLLGLMVHFFYSMKQACTYVVPGILYSQEYISMTDLIFQNVDYNNLEISGGLFPCIKLSASIHK